MDAYGHSTEIRVRFRDLDTNGHVNNALYATYLEQARAAYFADVIGVPLADAEIVLARLTIEFEAPIEFEDGVAVETRVPSVGDSSFPMEHVIRVDGALAATADSVVVPFDLDTGSARPVPSAWRERIRRHGDGDS